MSLPTNQAREEERAKRETDGQAKVRKCEQEWKVQLSSAIAAAGQRAKRVKESHGTNLYSRLDG